MGCDVNEMRSRSSYVLIHIKVLKNQYGLQSQIQIHHTLGPMLMISIGSKPILLAGVSSENVRLRVSDQSF